jgi:hypothetical protein
MLFVAAISSITLESQIEMASHAVSLLSIPLSHANVQAQKLHTVFMKDFSVFNIINSAANSELRETNIFNLPSFFWKQ